MQTYLDFKIKKTSFGDKDYPKELAKIHKPPKQVYYRGELDSGILEKSIAIVGSRLMTNYGKLVIDKYVSEFVANGITIISGFMYGVDTEAHKKTIEYGGKTISVFGNGLNYIYPPENDKLYFEILNTGGAVISEYKEDTKPQLWTYPARNRIVAGLATLGVLVVEADEDSGSIITANLAIKQKKKVWAVPGQINLKSSKGTNKLIKDGLAYMTTYPADILQKETKVEQIKLQELTQLESEVYTTIQRENLSIDEIAIVLKKNVVEITSALTMMSLKGIVTEAGGKFYIS